ncbi:MAG TPA: hypothetical protein VFG50_14280, partial [Rhodothermales bacterium]|nr:hypothetical protein [Rhodothermales bacterium]
MKHRVTVIFLMSFLLALPSLAQTPPVRTDDVKWARDIGDAAITFDGMLDEDVWQSADSLVLIWDNPNYTRPGGGWGTVDAAEFEPTDPVDARVYLLRKADTLWIGVRANDKSIG